MKEDYVKGYFAFEEDDLLANRDGKLSDTQSKRIREADQFAERLIRGLFFICLTGGIFLSILAVYTRNNVWFWVGMASLLLIATWLFRGIRSEVDDTVQKVQGEVSFVKVRKKKDPVDDSSSRRRKASGYEMRVGSEVFVNVNPVGLEHMQGNTYTVYFTRTTRQILSVEPISEQVATEKGGSTASSL